MQAEATSLLIVSGFWPTRQNPISGIFIVQQLEAFAAKGIRCEVLVAKTRFRGEQDRLSVADLGLSQDLVELIVVPSWRIPEKLSSLPGAIAINTRLQGMALAKALCRYSKGKEYDACILHGMRYEGFCLPRWRKYLPCPLVAVLHGVDPFMLRSENLPRIRRILSDVNPLLDVVVLVGNPLRKHAIEIGLAENKLRVVANGVALPQNPQSNERVHSSSAPIRVLSVANLIPLKGLDDNLKALARIAEQHPELNWEYVIVGEGPFRSELEALSRELGLESRVSFLGRLPYEATQIEMTKADIFSLPSWNEAFGIVYLEAMAQGVPVVGCLENGAADIVTHGQDGFLVRPKTVDDLAKSLRQLLSDVGLRQKMGDHARITAEGYSWDWNACEMLKVLGLDQYSV